MPLDPQPPQPPRPVSTYVDPADLVAATASKAKADDIKTWSITEIDKKGKKKKGTLGIGNGAIFFASESDKVCLELPRLLNGEPLKLILNSLTLSSDSSSEMADLSDHVLRPLTRQSQTHPHRDLLPRARLPSLQRRLQRHSRCYSHQTRDLTRHRYVLCLSSACCSRGRKRTQRQKPSSALEVRDTRQEERFGTLCGVQSCYNTPSIPIRFVFGWWCRSRARRGAGSDAAEWAWCRGR